MALSSVSGDFASFIELIDPETVVLTPNLRLARYLQHSVDTCYTQNLIAYPSVAIYACDNYLQECYLSSKQQERELLTEQKLFFLSANFLEKNKFIDYNDFYLIKQILKAWHFMHAWGINHDLFTAYANAEQEWFFNFFQSFSLYLEEIACITSAQLLSVLQEVDLPIQHKKIILFAMDECPTMLGEYFSNLKTKSALHFDIQWSLATEKTAYCFDTLEEEITTMANWAKAAVAAGKKSIICVVQNLAEQRLLIQDIFQSVFYPDKYFYALAENPSYSITGGEPLYEQGLIKAIFQIFSLLQEPVAYASLYHLLSSPYLMGGCSELTLRALALSSFRSLGFLEFSHAYLRDSLESFNWPATAKALLKKIFSFDVNLRMSFAQWADYLSHFLESCNWPGERVLSSIEYQQVQQFYALLQELGSITDEKLSFKSFTAYLKFFLQTRFFQAKTEETPIKIMGVLEAAGQAAEQIWLMNLSDQTWPEVPQPNPFIPVTLQKKYALPHASAERELAFSQNVQKRFLQSTPTVIFSSARQHADLLLGPSPLIFSYLSTTDKIMGSLMKKQTAALEPDLTEWQVVEKNALALKDKRLTVTSRLFESQLNCPFQAFAELRLKIHPLKPLSFKTNKALRGLLWHSVLQRVWEVLGSWEGLVTQRARLLDFSMEQAKKIVPFFYRQYAAFFSTQFIEMETQRIAQQLSLWLSLELKRQPFDLYAIEKQMTFQIKNLDVRIRIDRIDKLETGNLLIIDYKTAALRETIWLLADFSAPQLPLYSLLFPQKVEGIAFGILHPEAMDFRGLVTTRAALPSKAKQAFTAKALGNFLETADISLAENLANPSSIEMGHLVALQSIWQAKIEAIADAFIAGDYPISPKERKSCTFCQRQSLCRIFDGEKPTC